MKSKAAIRAKPPGHRWLLKGEVIRASDRYWIPAAKEWRRADHLGCFGFTGDVVGRNFGDLDSQPWIRRTGKPKGKPQC